MDCNNDYYNKISDGYNGLYAEEQTVKLGVIKKETGGLPSEFRLLDIGCGTGISSGFSCFVVGIDPSIELLKINKNNNKINGIAEYLPFRDNSFDIVISVTALHNFKDIEKGLDEIRRVGKNLFVFSVLKKSEKFRHIGDLIYSGFTVTKRVEEEKDIIFFTKQKK